MGLFKRKKKNDKNDDSPEREYNILTSQDVARVTFTTKKAKLFSSTWYSAHEVDAFLDDIAFTLKKQEGILLANQDIIVKNEKRKPLDREEDDGPSTDTLLGLPIMTDFDPANIDTTTIVTDHSSAPASEDVHAGATAAEAVDNPVDGWDGAMDNKIVGHTEPIINDDHDNMASTEDKTKTVVNDNNGEIRDLFEDAKRYHENNDENDGKNEKQLVEAEKIASDSPIKFSAPGEFKADITTPAPDDKHEIYLPKVESIKPLVVPDLPAIPNVITHRRNPFG